MALAPSLIHVAKSTNNEKAEILAETLDQAIESYLDANKSPSRVVNEPDNRTSHFYLTLFWTEALANQEKSKELQEQFAPIAKKLRENEEIISKELLSVQGSSVDIGGYYKPKDDLATKAMRPSQTFNEIIDTFNI